MLDVAAYRAVNVAASVHTPAGGGAVFIEVLFSMCCCLQHAARSHLVLLQYFAAAGLHIRALAEPYSCMSPLALLLHAIADTLCVAAAATCCCNVHRCILQLQHCRCFCEVLLHDE